MNDSHAHTMLDGRDITMRFIHERPKVEDEEFPAGALREVLPRLGAWGPPYHLITICITSAGNPTLEAAQSWLALQGADPSGVKFVIVPNGPYMDMGRNKTIFEAMSRTDSEWLMTLDDDIAFTPGDVTRLVEWACHHNIHVAGGIYASPRDGQNYAVAYRHDETGDNYVDLTLAEIDAMDPARPATCQVAAVGTGFLLIHRSVLELMMHFYDAPQPWFAELTVPTPDPRNPRDALLGTHLGEDLTFCRRLWALGIPVYVAPHVRLTHTKKLGIALPPHPGAR